MELTCLSRQMAALTPASRSPSMEGLEKLSGFVSKLTIPSCWEILAWMEPAWIMETSSASTSCGEERPTLVAKSAKDSVMKVRESPDAAPNLAAHHLPDQPHVVVPM